MDLVPFQALPTDRDDTVEADRLFADVRRHAIYQIAHAPIRAYPFAHVFVEDVFPLDFYARLQAALPAEDAYSVTAIDHAGRPEQFALSGRQARSERLDADRRAFWAGAFAAIDHADTGAWLIAKFYEHLADRLGLADPASGRDLRGAASLIRDRRARGEAPNTGAPSAVVTAIFQLPRTGNRRNLGPTLYAPRDPEFRCNGGRSHDRGTFDRIVTLPYKPNTLFALPKTDASFIGFEADGSEETCRDILRFDLTLPAKLVH